MRGVTLSRIVAPLALLLVGGCSDPFTTPPNSSTGMGANVSVVPGTATIISGEVVALKASMRDAYGDPLTDVQFAWRSSNDAVATVSSTGEVVGRSAGRASITATAQGRAQSSAIHVLARGPKPNVDPGRF
jgi:uncharacterized protein YjdB